MADGAHMIIRKHFLAATIMAGLLPASATAWEDGKGVL
jgi:hypothetical protein